MDNSDLLFWKNILKVEEKIPALKKAHPRSKFTDRFISQVRQIVRGKEVPRNCFNVDIGPQWGLAFVDDLIKDNVICLFKVSRKLMLKSKE